MSDSNENAAAILARHFCNDNSPLGTDWVDSVLTGLSENSHHHLVLSTGSPTAAKMRNMYGQF
jgi:hypothetical protein